MPTIKRFPGCRIEMYPGDHNPPHFHIVGIDWKIAVRIGSLEVMRQSGKPRQVADAIQWAAKNQSHLWEMWRRLNVRG
jgi:hypothetical protein